MQEAANMSFLILTDSRGWALQKAMEKFDIPASGLKVQVLAYSDILGIFTLV